MATATATPKMPALSDTPESVLVKLQSGEIDLATYLAWDKAVKAALSAKAGENKLRELTWKVARKGGLSVYGLNTQFPITLYREQWERLFAKADEIKAYMASDPVSEHPEEKDKDGKLVKVAQKVRLKAKGEAEGAHVVG